MTVTAKTLVPAKVAENTQTTQYTASNVTTIIDKFTATNYSVTAATISVNLTNPSEAASTSNLVTYNKTLQPAETYTFPEIVGHVLTAGGSISTIASATLAINIRASGREVT